MMKKGWRSPRSWTALLLLIVAWFALPVVEEALRGPPARLLHMHIIQGGALALGPFAWKMAVRLVLDLALLAAMLRILGLPVAGFPLTDRRGIGRLLLGADIGVGVMVPPFSPSWRSAPPEPAVNLRSVTEVTGSRRQLSKRRAPA